MVYSCEYVCLLCFVLLLCFVNVFFYVSCVIWCSLTCFIFRCNWCWDWVGGMNMYVCMYVQKTCFFLLAGANGNYTLIHQWKLWCSLYVLKLHFLEVKIYRKVTRGTIVWLLKTPFTSKMNMYVIIIIALLWIEGCHMKTIPRIGI